MRHCRRCERPFVARTRTERYCGCEPRPAQSQCSECSEPVRQRLGKRGRPGRPRKTCSTACAHRRERRLLGEILFQDRHEATRWWLSLTQEQQAAAMAYVKLDPPPEYFRGGRQLWAYFCRAAFSCEGVPVSLEAA